MNDTVVTVVGNLTQDPELRFTNNGMPVASLNLASTPRVYNRFTSEWEDGDTLFFKVTVWQDMAENVAESLSKGDRIIVSGTLRVNNWVDKHDQKRSDFEITATEVGVTLRFHTAKPVKVSAKPEPEPVTRKATARRR